MILETHATPGVATTAPMRQSPHSLNIRSKAVRLLAVVLGCLCLTLGMIGAFLPLLPSTPFFLCAADCFAHASPRLEAWLTSFKIIGGPVRAWRERGAIALPAKVLATFGMGLSLIIYVMSGPSSLAVGACAGVLALCATFIWTRPA